MPILGSPAALPLLTASIPIYYSPGFYPRISTNITWGTAPNGEVIDSIVDTNSAAVWVYGPKAIINSGSNELGFPGPCNDTAKPFFDWTQSPTHQGVANFSDTYVYGGNGKIVTTSHTVNDTATFTGTDWPVYANVQTAISNYTFIKELATTCTGTPYDHSILGLLARSSTFDHPSFRDNLHTAGHVTQGNIFSIWMDKLSGSVDEALRGQVLFGCIAKDVYKGDLLEIPNQVDPKNEVGYYVTIPKVKVNGQIIPTVPASDTEKPLKTAVLDSGSGTLTLPVDDKAFYNATGLVDNGYAAYPGKCDDIPEKASFTLEFENNAGKTVDVEIQIRALAKFGEQPDPKKCNLLLSVGEHAALLGAPFYTGAFTAYDDDKKSIYIAQGGVSQGSGKYSKVKCQ